MDKIIETAFCKDCGKSRMPFKDFNVQTEADEWATVNCDCPQGKKSRDLARIKRELNNFEKYCEAKKYTLSSETKELLQANANLVLERTIDSVSIGLFRIKIKISLNSKGNLIFSSKYSEALKTEV